MADEVTPEERAEKLARRYEASTGRTGLGGLQAMVLVAIREGVAAEREAILQELIARREQQIAAQNFDYACGFRDSIDFIRDRNQS